MTTSAPSNLPWWRLHWTTMLALPLVSAMLAAAEGFVLIKGHGRWYEGARQGVMLATAIGLALATACLWIHARRQLRWYQVDLKTFAALATLAAVLFAACSSCVLRGYQERPVLSALRGRTLVEYESCAPA